jgi:hypothetical protein
MRSPSRKTIGLLYASSGAKQPANLRQWLNGLPELSIMADFLPLSTSREGNGGTGFTALAQAIVRHYLSVDGFVVMGGHEHVLYLAAALSFSLSGLGKPVVVVGATPVRQRPGELSAGLKADFINAVQAATLRFGEVAVISGNRLVRGNTAAQAGGVGAAYFTAPASAVLGRIDFSIRLMERNLRPIPRTKIMAAPLAPRVDYVVLTPWHDKAMLQQRLHRASALLLNLRTYAAVPAWLERWLKTAAAKKPIGVLTADAAVAIRQPTIGLPTGTPEAMLAKLAWATALAKTPARVSSLMVHDVAGELSL